MSVKDDYHKLRRVLKLAGLKLKETKRAAGGNELYITLRSDSGDGFDLDLEFYLMRTFENPHTATFRRLTGVSIWV